MITRCARNKAKLLLVKKIIFIVVVTLTLYIAVWEYIGLSEAVLPVSANVTLQQERSGVLQLPKWRDILFAGVPRLTSTTGAQPVVKVNKENGIQQVLRETIMFFTNVDIKDVRSLLQAEIPVLASVKSGPQTVSAMSLPNFPKFETTNNLPSGKPLVGLYYTHTAESFIPSIGATHRPGGQRGDIVDVGEALVKRLQTYGISTVQNTTINDYPSFMKAYGASEVTVTQMLAENPSLQMIFDIHRDAEKRENCTATVNGVQVAKIMIIVATGQQDLIQPHWQQNHAFAKLIDAKLNQRYPGISRGIHMENWRYNQHLHPRALLIEVGSQESTKEEAQASIELFGDIIAEIIAENNKQ